MGVPFQVAFSPDGHSVALASQSNVGEVGRVEVWEVGAPSWYRQPSAESLFAGAVDAPRSMCFSSDSRMLICTKVGGMSRWDIATRKIMKPLRTNFQPWEAGDGKYAQTWPHSDVLTTSTYDGWQGRNVRSGALKSHTIQPDPNAPYGSVLAFAPDGRTVAWHIDEEDVVVLRDTKTARLQRLAPPSRTNFASKNASVLRYIDSLTFSPDSRFLAVGWRDEDVSGTASLILSGTKLWDVQTRKISAQWGEDDKIINAHAFSPDGSLIASARSDGAISLRETKSGKLLRFLKQPSTNVSSVAFSPNGRTLASCGSDGALYLWRIQ